MTKTIKTQVTINASAHNVWDVLTDIKNYSNWNPFIREIKGILKVDEFITVKIEPKKGKTMTFNPKVLTLEKEKLFIWKGKFLIKGLFDGTHKFELIEHINGSTTLIHSETFSGLVVGLFNLESTRKGFEKMNLKLKEECEKAQAR